MTITVNSKVGELVAEKPSRSRLFEKIGIDYCCGGKKTIAEACAKKGLDATTFLAMLDSVETLDDSGAQDDFTTMPLTELANHIVNKHHTYLRQELPRLNKMAHKVAAVHGGKDPRLTGVETVFTAVREELESHMVKEENILFPIIRSLESGQAAGPFHCGGLANPIRVMEAEHDTAGGALTRLRELTDDYTPPAEACNTWRALLDGLREFEEDLHQHIHKENNILFPRALALESGTDTSSACVA